MVSKYFVWLYTPCDSGKGCQKLRGTSTKCRNSQGGKMLTANQPKSHKSIMKHFVRSALFPENSVDEITVLLVVAACNLTHGCQYFEAASG
jgi:hypothetical protein